MVEFVLFSTCFSDNPPSLSFNAVFYICSYPLQLSTFPFQRSKYGLLSVVREYSYMFDKVYLNMFMTYTRHVFFHAISFGMPSRLSVLVCTTDMQTNILPRYTNLSRKLFSAFCSIAADGVTG